MNQFSSDPNLIENFPEYLDSDDINKSAERYVFFPGDIISPRRKQETREHEGIGLSVNGSKFRITANGGDEYQTQCLTRTKGFVPRAFITPLEVAAYWVPPEIVPNGADTFRSATSSVSSPQIAGGVIVGGKAQYLVGEKVFPGQALTWILAFARNDQGYSRGLVEIEEIRGVKWSEGAATDLQSIYFPNYPAIPMTISDMQKEIQARMAAQSGDVRSAGQRMLYACDEFRDWGLAFLGREHNLVKLGTTQQGWTYDYSDTARLLMEQLNVTPQDQQFQTVARMQEEQSRAAKQMMEAMTAKGDSSDDLKRMFLASMENQNKIMEMLAKSLALKVESPAVKDEKPTAAPKNPPKTEK